MKTTLTPEQRFGIHRKTGRFVHDVIAQTRPKATLYELVDVSFGQRRVIKQATRKDFGLLKHLEKLHKTNQNDLRIEPVYQNQKPQLNTLQ